MVSVSDKRSRFIDEYLVDSNGTQAAIRSGYSVKTAASQSSRLLKDVKVQALLTERRAAVQVPDELSQTWVLYELMKVVRSVAHTSQHVRALELLGKHVGLFRDAPAVQANGALLTVTAQLSGLSDDELRNLAIGIGSAAYDTAYSVMEYDASHSLGVGVGEP